MSIRIESPNNNSQNIPDAPSKPSAKVDFPVHSPISSQNTLKNEVSVSANEKVEKAAVRTLGLGRTLLGILKAFVLIASACALAFVLMVFVVHMALPLAIGLGILCGIGIIIFTLWGLFEFGRLNYQPTPSDFDLLPNKC